MAAANRVTKKKTILYRFSEKHKEYIRRCRECSYNVAEGAVRAGKTVDNVFAFAHELKTTPDKIHLATGSTMANAKMNIGDCNGMGLEWIFRGQSHWGKYKDNEALFIKGPATHNRQKIVIFAGGAKEDSYKKIRGNSYGMWIATEINLHHDNTIKEAFNRQLAAKRLKVFWDLNPDNPRAAIYSEYIDRYQRQQEEGNFPGGYNYMHCTIYDKESAVHIAQSLLKRDQSTGEPVYPAGKKRLYRAIEYNTGATDKPFMDTFSPDIRDTSYFNGWNHLMRMIEFDCNLAYGTISDPNNTDKTAEEIKASKQRSYSFVQSCQTALQHALEDLVDAIAFWCDIYQLCPSGTYQTSFDWDDSIVTDVESERQSDRLDVSMGAMPLWEYRMKWYGETEEQAKAAVQKPEETVIE